MNFEQNLDKLFVKSIVSLSQDGQRNSILALKDFKERYQRLGNRYSELSLIEASFVKATWSNTEDTRLIQPIFIDKLEAYFQQLYSVESALVKLLNHIGGHKFLRGISISSIESFLLNFKKQKNIKINNLIRALDFRTRIDHAQIKGTFDYLTCATPHNTLQCLYFRPNGKEKIRDDILLQLGFPKTVSSPVEGSDWFIPPYYKELHSELQLFTINLLKLNLRIPI